MGSVGLRGFEGWDISWVLEVGDFFWVFFLRFWNLGFFFWTRIVVYVDYFDDGCVYI